MALHRLKLNDDKTEYLLILSFANSSKITVQTIPIRDSGITSTFAARNIGVVFDDKMDREADKFKVCQTCFFWLGNIRQIRHCPTFDATQILVQSLILSYRLLKYKIAKLQRVQNSAAHFITCTPCREHITPVLVQLHCLPVSKRVTYRGGSRI